MANGSDSAAKQQLTNEVTTLIGKGLDLKDINVAVALTDNGITDKLDPRYRLKKKTGR